MVDIGMKRFPAGRMNEAPSVGLSASLNAAGFKLGRLQTGTPARLAVDTIDFSKMEVQKGDEDPLPFSFMNDVVANAVNYTYLCRDCFADVTDPGQPDSVLADEDDAGDAPDHPGQHPPVRSYSGDEERWIQRASPLFVRH